VQYAARFFTTKNNGYIVYKAGKYNLVGGIFFG